MEFRQLLTTEQPWSSLGTVKSVEQGKRSVDFECGGPRLSISVLASNLIRVRLAPTGQLMPHRSWAVTRNDPDWPMISFEVRQTSEAVEIITEQMRVQVESSPCRILCFDKMDRPFAQDANPAIGWRMGTTAGWKQIEAGEHFYGFGERSGLLDKLAEVKTNWTYDAYDYSTTSDNLYQAIPFFMALRPGVGYGLFFNTTFWSRFDIGASQPGTLQMETHGSELDYYIIYGLEPSEILHTYTELTGRMSLPPRWALGYHQCRWSYNSEVEVRELAGTFRDRQIPCDVIHLDIDYMRGFRVFTWSPKRFFNPAQLIKDLAQSGFKTVTIIDPGVKYELEENYHVFDQGLEQDYFIRQVDGELFHGYVWPEKSVFPDFLRPDVRAWWGELHRSLTDIGVAGIWNDMNEPSVRDQPFSGAGQKISPPLDAPQGPMDERTTHAEAHNLYGLTMVRACREGLDRLRSTERSFVLTRSGYAGIQRWSSVWTGDNRSLWEHLEMSLPMLSNLGLSGIAFVGADIGGFAGNATAELFARWMQVGLLYPLMRGHSAIDTARHEPWVFGNRTEQICREYIELRYRLLPYIYTLFWEAATTGTPILRPLLYHFPNDSHTYTLHDQVFFGPFLMAAPVYRPGVEYRAVYLPEGTWYDWWSGERYQGPIHILAHAPLEQMPMYVRAGAIIPLAPVMQHTDEHSLNPLMLRIWPGEGEWTLYEDDGHTFKYQQGTYAITPCCVRQEGQRLIVEIRTRSGQYVPSSREVIVDVVGIGQQHYQDDGTARRLTFGSHLEPA